MTNEDVIDLYARVNVGTKVVVLPMHPTQTVASQDRFVPRTTVSTAANAARAHGVY
jgi:hypothetical protein